MMAKPLVKLSDEQQEDLKAEVRSTMFFMLRSAFKDRSKRKHIRAKDLAEALGKDEGYVSRILKGVSQSITIETLVIFLEALNYNLQIKACRNEDLSCLKANFDARPFTPIGSLRVTSSKSQDFAKNNTSTSSKGLKVRMEKAF